MRAVIVGVLALGLVGSAAAADAPVATVGTRSITRAELEAHIKPKLIEIETEKYDAMKEGLDDMIGDELLKQEAAARKITPEELEKQEIASKLTEPTDAEIQKVYDDNKAQLGGQTLDQVKPRIIQFLKQQAGVQKREEYLTSLKSKYKTTVALRPPVIEVSGAGRPERGGANAKVTIIEWSDYECPFCKRAEATVEQVMTTYGDKVKLIYRDYPLPFHAHARPAAEAANCANAQGKFWEYNKKLFAAQDLSTEKLKSMADEVKLDRTKFDDCLTKTPYKAAIDKDIADGAAVGVNGTPAFFINGRMLSGAQPFEKFKEVIDDELANAKPS
jgi:protein-disulfide isomerase